MSVSAQWCVKFTFRDAKGQTRAIEICWAGENSGTQATLNNNMVGVAYTLVPLLQALSNAHVQSESNFQGGGTAQSGVTWGATGAYQSVSQQAKLTYLTQDPSGDPSPVGTITIPAPKASIFLADAITVDPANAGIVALNAEVLGTVPLTNTEAVCTKSGLLFVTFVGGTLVGKRLSRKFNRYTYNPELTVAGI